MKRLVCCLLILLSILTHLIVLTYNVFNTVETIEVTEEPKSYYSITIEERYLLAKLVHAEASIFSHECKVAVASVVFNRLDSGKWTKDINNDGFITIYDIIYYPNAFTPTVTGAMDKWEPTIEDYEAVDYVLTYGSILPTEIRYFRTDYDFNWEHYKNYIVIDNVYFGYFENWEQGEW